MNLSEDQIDVVRTTFMQVSDELQRAGDLFYQHLFEIAPETRELFLSDMSKQGVKLMSTLGLVVSQLQHWSDLEPVVQDMAQRHVAYGVKETHYDAVREALHAMLTDMLDIAYTEDARDAWDQAYRSLAATMIRSAYDDRVSGSIH